MITGGISFQPGGEDSQKKIDTANNANGSQEGVQEAIKVLSLRLPKVVGARAIAPGQLLTGQGSGGQRNVDSMVEAVMQKFFPTGPAQPEAPGQPMGFEGFRTALNTPGYKQQDIAPNREYTREGPRAPNVIVGNPPPEYPGVGGPPPRYPDQPTWDGGMPNLGGVIAPAPEIPDLRKQLDWLQPEPNGQPLI